MAIEQIKSVIGDDEYTVVQWIPEVALEIKFEMAQTFGGSLTALAGALGVNEEGQESIEEGNLTAAVNNIFKNKSPKELVDFIKRIVFGGNVYRNGEMLKPHDFVTYFSGGDLGKIYPVVFAVLKANYGPLVNADLLKNMKTRLTAIANRSK